MLMCFSNRNPGGYYHRLFVTPLQELQEFICPICQDVIHEASLIEDCGHHFCSDCLARSLQKKKECPICRTTEIKCAPNKQLDRKINQFRVRCPNYVDNEEEANHERGCKWEGELSDLMNHLDRDCPNKEVLCPFKDAGCTKKIVRKDMDNHMKTNQQRHMLLILQSLKQSTEQLRATKQGLGTTKQELYATKQELRATKQELYATKQNIPNVIQIMTVGLPKIGDTLTFRVADFPQLREEKKAWHSPPFSIGDKVRVRLAVWVGRGQGSHVSVSLILKEVVQKEEDMYLQYNVSVAAIGQYRSATSKTLELVLEIIITVLPPSTSPHLVRCCDQRSCSWR